MLSCEPFTPEQMQVVNQAVSLAEELVSNYYKMSASQWLRPKYDIKTLADLAAGEITEGPFAQIIRYEGKRKDALLGSAAYDFYKICLQDHMIRAATTAFPDLKLYPFILYIVVHELIHVVRFSRFLQNFDATPNEKLEEEWRVHEETRQILNPLQMDGLADVLAYYQKWRQPLEKLQNS
jgi:hypothetical protein